MAETPAKPEFKRSLADRFFSAISPRYAAAIDAAEENFLNAAALAPLRGQIANHWLPEGPLHSHNGGEPMRTLIEVPHVFDGTAWVRINTPEGAILMSELAEEFGAR